MRLPVEVSRPVAPMMLEQVSFFDRFNSLPEAVQSQIEDTYGVYRNDLMPVLIKNIDKLKAVFEGEGKEERFFHPSDNALISMGMMFILQVRDHASIDEILMRMNTDVAYQYVLFSTSNSVKPLISRSYYTLFRKKLAEYDARHDSCLMATIFSDFTDVAASEMGINLHQDLGDELRTRIDSMLIDTPAEHLTRAGIIYRTNAMCLDLVASLNGLVVIPEDLQHYLDDSDENAVVYHNKEGKMDKLTWLLNDSLRIKSLLEGYQDFEEYGLVCRVITEQGILAEDGTISPKPDQKIEGSSMQSPLYPSGTCRKKYGFQIGDAVCFTEASRSDLSASLLTEVLYGKNIISDDEFMMEHLRRKDPNGPIEVCSCDAGFFSMATVKAAVEAGVILIPSDLKGSLPKPLMAGFTMADDSQSVLTCPKGHAPIDGSQKYNPETNSVSAKFDKATCEACPFFGECPVKAQAKACKVEVSQLRIDLAEQVCAIDSRIFQEYANYRNAIESVPSVMRRTYGFDSLHSMNVSLRKEMIFAASINYNCKKLNAFRKNRDSVKKAA